MTPYEAYKLYVGLKSHFTGKYDFIKYQGKTRANIKMFEKRKDKFFFTKLSKHQDPMGLIISNFLELGPDIWIGELFEEKNNKIYTNWLSRKESLSYQFKTELDRIGDNFIDSVKVKNGQHPEILTMYKSGKVSAETLIILNQYLKFFPVWDRKIDDPVIWPGIRQKCLNYSSFLHYDKERIKSILKSFLVEIEQINSNVEIPH